MATTDTEQNDTEVQAPVEHRARKARRWRVQRRGNYWVESKSIEEQVAEKKVPQQRQEPQPQTVRDIPVVFPSVLWCTALIASAVVSEYALAMFCLGTAITAAIQRISTEAKSAVIGLYTLCGLSLAFMAVNNGIGWAISIICFGIAYDIGESVFSNEEANSWDVPLATAATLMTTALVVAVVISVSNSTLPWLCAFTVWLLAPAAHQMFKRLNISTPQARYTSCRFDSITLAAPVCAIFVALMH